MPVVHVDIHAEGTNDVHFKIHGTKLETEGDWETYTNVPSLEWGFSGRAGTRVRVTITHEFQVVYREEVQLPLGLNKHETEGRSFRINNGTGDESQAAQPDSQEANAGESLSISRLHTAPAAADS